MCDLLVVSIKVLVFYIFHNLYKFHQLAPPTPGSADDEAAEVEETTPIPAMFSAVGIGWHFSHRVILGGLALSQPHAFHHVIFAVSKHGSVDDGRYVWSMLGLCTLNQVDP
jgi:hypothetical protein